MKWTTDSPSPGDIIRVKVKFYYHYGIFVDENTVVQFGYPDNEGIPPKEIAVVTTDVETFLAGGFGETASITKAESKSRRSPQKTVDYALSKVGTTGYNILHNNCEHFVNECVFGNKTASYTDSIRQKIKNKLKNRKEKQ